MMFMEVKVRWKDEWMEMLFWNSKYDTNAHMLFIFPHSHTGQEPYIHPAACGDPALPFCGLQYRWVQVSLPWLHAQQSHWCPNALDCSASPNPTPTSSEMSPRELARPP